MDVTAIQPARPAESEKTTVNLVAKTFDETLAMIDAMSPEDRTQVSAGWLARVLRGDADHWTLGYSIVDAKTAEPVGDCGYKGPPSADGIVEIAYAVAPERRCRGYATAAARQLVAIAVASGLIKIVRAHTLPGTNASTRVLARCGFNFAGEVTDPDDGQVWRWEFHVPQGGIRAGFPTDTILSARLALVPFPPDFIRASLNSGGREAGLGLGFRTPPDWPGPHAGILALRLEQLETNGKLQPWLLRGMIDRVTREMIGHIGFHTAPNPPYLTPHVGTGIEFGLAVFPAHRRRGFAAEASIALMHWANRLHGVRRFVMTINPENRPSRRLAARLGFTKVGSHIDESDGPENILSKELS